MSTLCDLRVAILGNKNVGKATVLFSLLGRDFSGIINTKTVEGAKPDIVSIEAVVDQSPSDKENAYASIVREKPVELDDGIKVNEITYRSAIPGPIVKMRPGTDFCFSIYPSPAEGEEYRRVLFKNWDTFDAVIFVVDAKKGICEIDTEYLKVVQELHSQAREIPILVICNKVDDKENEKIAKHLKKAKSKVRKLLQNDDGEGENETLSIFSIQAQKALAFRAGSKMTVYEFEDFDKDLMALIGKEKFGKDDWKAMSHEDRYRYTHEHIVGKKTYKEGMSACGFDKVMHHFEALLGGDSRQKGLLQARIDRILETVRPFQNDWISYSLFTAYTRQRALLCDDKEKEELEEKSAEMRALFWKMFDDYQKGTFLKFMNAFPQKIAVVSDPLQELQYYHKLVEVAKWSEEEELILEKQKAYLQQYLCFLKTKESETRGTTEWDAKALMSPFDWCYILQSILLLGYDSYFCENFGSFKIAAETMVFQAQFTKLQFTKLTGVPEVCPYCMETLDETKQKPAYNRCKPCNKVYVGGSFEASIACGYCGASEVSPEKSKCENCKYDHEPLINVAEWPKTKNDEQGFEVPVHESLFSKIIHVSVPEKLSDPKHFGHPVFKASAFSKVISAGKSNTESK